MIPIPSGVRVWIATGHTDMRRGMQSLALTVQESLRRDPHAGDLYIFRGRRGDLVKILWHDGLGMSLYAKRGPWQGHLALGVGRCGVDLGGPDGLHARRHRLAESATELAATKRGLSAESVASCILGNPIASNL
jgi:transposase